MQKIRILPGDMKNIFSVTYQEIAKVHKKRKGNRAWSYIMETKI